MKNKIINTILTASLMGLTSCDKGGGTFSFSSDSSQFQQAATFAPRKLDVLFVVDNSGSMQTSQTNLAANFPSFINYFKSKGYDFRIAVTTTDAYYGDVFLANGCSLCNVQQTQFRATADQTAGATLYRVVDNVTPNLDLVFSNNVQVGTRGSGDERAFSSMRAALSSSLNSGFHRSDAYLSVIIVSDSDDYSYAGINIYENLTGTLPPLDPIDTYVNYLNTFTKGLPTSDYSVSTIGVLDVACRNLLKVENKISNRYMALSDATGGTKNSICSSFDSVLNNISSTIASNTQAQFQLTKNPVIESIRVIINGVIVPQDAVNGWTYDANSKIISVHGTYSPDAGSSIVINFDPAI